MNRPTLGINADRSRRRPRADGGAGSGVPRRLRLPTASPGHLRVRRRQVIGMLAVALVAVAVRHTVDTASEVRESWSGDRPVAVLRSPVVAGRRLRDRDVTVAHLPGRLVPTDAVGSLPVGAAAAIDLRPGTVLGRSMIVTDRRSNTARRLERGHVAVAVRTGDVRVAVEPGDLVDAASPGWEAPVARSARVVRVSDDTVTLAVRESDATATATASLSGPVALLLRP